MTIGVPIAIRLPKTSARITIAETLPMSSLSPVSGDESTEPIDPPTATSMPALVAGCVASRMAWASRSVMKPESTLSSTGMKAIRSSSDNKPTVLPSFAEGVHDAVDLRRAS